MGFTPLQCGLCGLFHLPRQLAANVTSLRQSKEYSFVIKQGHEQRDYVTVNYSVTLELRAKKQSRGFVSLFLEDNIS